MNKVKIYCIQLFGVLALLLVYLVNDRPDKESVMHFDHSAQHVISHVAHGGNSKNKMLASRSNEKNHHGHGKHRTRTTVKIFPFNISLPRPVAVYQYEPMLCSSYIFPESEEYYYLYTKEINPPPPKLA